VLFKSFIISIIFIISPSSKHCTKQGMTATASNRSQCDRYEGLSTTAEIERCIL